MERGKAGLGVIRAPRPDRVAQQGDVKAFTECVDGGLINTNGCLNPAQQEVLNLMLIHDCCTYGIISKSGKRALAQRRRSGGEGQQFWCGASELFWDLLGKHDR